VERGRRKASRGRHKTSMEWPVEVDERLRLLVSLAEQSASAGTTSASELVAALICEQPLDSGLLADRVVRYRQTTPAEIAVVTQTHPTLAGEPRRGRPRRSSDPGPR
jgi:hypothetical protein